MRKLEKNEILEKFKEKHSNNYDYSKFEYVGYHKKTIIICKIHGGFLQTPSKHIIGQGCKICNIKYSIGEIKDKLYKIHGDKYDFIFGDDVIDTRSKIKIKCNHGIKELQIRSLLQGQ